MRHLALLCTVAVMSAPGVSQSPPARTPERITILYDAFTDQPGLVSDWGYAALVEADGKRILFDTGNNAAAFEANVKRLNVDLTRLDLVVISHRHGDHTAGLRYVLSLNPNVPIHTPYDEAFLDTTPPIFMTKNPDPGLPSHMRYFGGTPPVPPPSHGTAWPGVRLRTVERMEDVTPRIHLVSTMSETPGFRDMPELSLVVDTPQGPVVIVGCSHPGIANILANVSQLTRTSEVLEVVGGLHTLLDTPSQVEQTVSVLVDRYHVRRVAPGHCTGERVFGILQKRFGKDYRYAGTGAVLPL